MQRSYTISLIRSLYVIVFFLALTPPVLGQIAKPTQEDRNSLKVEILSSTDDLDFRNYVSRVTTSIRVNLYASIEADRKQLETALAKTAVAQVTILPDGRIKKVFVSAPSGSDPLDRALVAGIENCNPFPSLPARFKGDFLLVRVSFFYNTN